MGSASMGPNLSATAENRLPRLHRQLSYFDRDGRPTQQMQQHWQNFAERIEQRFTDIESLLAQIQQAQATAAQAVQTANTTQSAIDLTNSYTNPVGVLSASSSGAVTVSAHQRIYGDGTSVSVNAGSVSGFAPGQAVTVYYTDPARDGGAVTYLGTTNAVSQTGDTHIVGQVTIPSVGQPDEYGTGPTAPGWKFEDGFNPLIEYELNT